MSPRNLPTQEHRQLPIEVVEACSEGLVVDSAPSAFSDPPADNIRVLVQHPAEILKREEQCLLLLSSSRQRGRERTRMRIEFTTLAVVRDGLRVCDISRLFEKHPNSVTKWLNRGLRRERTDPNFKNRLDRLDKAISIGI